MILFCFENLPFTLVTGIVCATEMETGKRNDRSQFFLCLLKVIISDPTSFVVCILICEKLYNGNDNARPRTVIKGISKCKNKLCCFFRINIDFFLVFSINLPSI